MQILYRFPEKAKNFVRHLGLSTTISLYRNASLTVTAIMKKSSIGLPLFRPIFVSEIPLVRLTFIKYPHPL